ncbi:MAG TPA: hypothetical protein VIM84_11640, partial [Gemmatimonadales bacterium]
PPRRAMQVRGDCMTACSGRQTGRQPFDHEAQHTAVVLRVRWNGGPLEVLVEHECMEWGCTRRGERWLEEARDEAAVLAHVGITLTRGP